MSEAARPVGWPQRPLWPLTVERSADLCLVGLFLVAAYALKRHASHATAQQLDWILGPTAALLELGTGTAWPQERGLGYLSIRHNTAVVTACAGVNFLVVAAATLVLGFTARFRSVPTKVGFLLVALPLAFAFTVATNALRILTDIAMRQQVLFAHSHCEAHRILGVLLYLGGACLLHALTDAALSGWRWGRPSDGPRLVFAVPAACYLGVALGVPWLNGAGARPAFWTHATVVLAVVTALAATVVTARRLRARPTGWTG